MGVAATLLAPEKLWEHVATVINLLGKMLERRSEELPGFQNWKYLNDRTFSESLLLF